MNQATRTAANASQAAAFRPVPLFSARPTAHKDAFVAMLSEASDIAMPNERVDEAFLTATRQFQSGKWQRAFSQLSVLADDGHAPAAKLALLMLRHGRTLFGIPFAAQPPQIARWAQYVLGRSMRAARDLR